MLHDQLREQSTVEQPREDLKPTGLASILGGVIITKYVKDTKTILDQAKEEMDAYLNFGTLSLGRGPLEWWKEYFLLVWQKMYMCTSYQCAIRACF